MKNCWQRKDSMQIFTTASLIMALLSFVHNDKEFPVMMGV